MRHCLTSLEAALVTGLCRGCVDSRVASCIAALYLSVSISKWKGKRPTRVSTVLRRQQGATNKSSRVALL